MAKDFRWQKKQTGDSLSARTVIFSRCHSCDRSFESSIKNDIVDATVLFILIFVVRRTCGISCATNCWLRCTTGRRRWTRRLVSRVALCQGTLLLCQMFPSLRAVNGNCLKVLPSLINIKHHHDGTMLLHRDKDDALSNFVSVASPKATVISIHRAFLGSSTSSASVHMNRSAENAGGHGSRKASIQSEDGSTYNMPQGKNISPDQGSEVSNVRLFPLVRIVSSIFALQ